MNDGKILQCFFVLRLLSVFIVQTWFVPDETWQATEVAHYLTYGNGYLCWEWKEGIRSILFPGIFSCIFYFLSILKLDFVFLLIHAPRIFSAITFAVGDYYMFKVATTLFGKGSSGWVAVSLGTSWFLSYCSPRTLSSCAEMTMFAITLFNYPWHHERDSASSHYMWWTGVGCILRPTLAITILPFCVRHILLCGKRFKLLLSYCFNVIVILGISTGTDSLFYGKFIVVPWNFLRFNLITELSTHYGTHPWYWYLTHGVPVTCGVHLLPVLLGICTKFGRYKTLSIPCIWSILVYSCLGHKEYRFLMPIVPLMLCIAGDYIFYYLKHLSSEGKKHRSFRAMFILLVLIIPNVVVYVYLSLIHQRGPIDVINQLRHLATSHSNPNILFLTPCHSTPYYSHMHLNIPMRFLTCEPNLNFTVGYKDEAEIFFENPSQWMNEEFRNKEDHSLPSHIVMFDVLVARTKEFLANNNFKLCSTIFNAHLYEAERGNYLHVYCNEAMT